MRIDSPGGLWDGRDRPRGPIPALAEQQRCRTAVVIADRHAGGSRWTRDRGGRRAGRGRIRAGLRRPLGTVPPLSQSHQIARWVGVEADGLAGIHGRTGNPVEARALRSHRIGV